MIRWISSFACAAMIMVSAPVAGTAQPSTAPPVDGGMASPPALSRDYPTPVDDGEPDRVYTATKDCIGSRPSTEPLRQRPWGQDRLRFSELTRFTGAGQTVAVIDTGVTEHDYLGGRLTGGGDYVVQDGTGLEDCDGHGTMVAGIIAADPKDERIGFRGIAPAARIVSIRQSSGVFGFKDPRTNQDKGAGSLVTLAKAVRRAADTDGVTVINMSVNSCRPVSLGPMTTAELDLQAALRYAVEERDVVVVASAGNFPEGDCGEQNSKDPRNPTFLVFPSWFSEYVLSVAAMTADGTPAPFSIRGPWVSVAAPGTDIISLDPVDRTALANQLLDKDGEPGPVQGTSFAAPYVSGLAALVRSQFPDLDAKQVMHRIKTTSAHPAARGGRDDVVGHGMINPVAALTELIPEEENIPRDEAVSVPFDMPPPHERDWTPLLVAMIGSGGGIGLLLLTLFVVHTVRRNRDVP